MMGKESSLAMWEQKKKRSQRQHNLFPCGISNSFHAGIHDMDSFSAVFAVAGNVFYKVTSTVGGFVKVQDGAGFLPDVMVCIVTTRAAVSGI
jgi:hypothetical protein